MFLENYTENGDVTGRTVIGIVSGGVGCGNNPDKKPNYPKWWARVSELKVTKNKIHNERFHLLLFSIKDSTFPIHMIGKSCYNQGKR